MPFDRKEKGLAIGSKAPMIETHDILGNEISLSNMLENYQGVLIDFFRGAW